MEVLLKFVIVVVGVVAMMLLTFRYKKTERRDEFPFNVSVFGAGFAVIVLVLMIGLVLSIGQVDAGNRGVVKKFGAVTERTLGEGLFFVTPFVNSVEMMDVQTQAYETPASAASKDLQDVATSVTLNYRLNPAEVNTVYQTLRRDYVQRIVVPAVQEGVKAVTARYDAEELITKRPAVKTDIEDVLRERLAKTGIILEAISITDFQFSAAFANSIEAKQVAVQDALRAENDLRRIEVEARQVEASAKGQANAAIAQAEGQKRSAVLRSEGEAQAILTVANAQAEANEVVNRTLTDKVIQYALVQELGDDIKVIVLPSGEQFILGPEVLGGK